MADLKFMVQITNIIVFKVGLALKYRPIIEFLYLNTPLKPLGVQNMANYYFTKLT